MNSRWFLSCFAAACLCLTAEATQLSVTDRPGLADFIVAGGKMVPTLFVETNEDPAVLRAANDLAEDFARVTGEKPEIENLFVPDKKAGVIIGSIGKSQFIDQLAAEGKLDTNGVAGAWESYVLQVVKDPSPQVACALVIAGSDKRGAIFGICQLSEMIGVSPWYWWADVPVARKSSIALRGDIFKQGPPAVKYRGIFLNDEDWGLRPWASKTFDPETGKIGPKTYGKIFELLLRLQANYLWPAMHPGTAPFNSFPEDPRLADQYGIVMGSSHCEQMLRNNISEWDAKKFGEYNFATNPDGVLKYWDERVRENGRFENLYTLGMRGIHDSGMPGGGTEREKAARLQTIIAAQRDMLYRHVNTNLAALPQIFCPYKEVLPLYRLMTNLPEDITLVWPDDNYGYIRQFSNASERRRSGGAGVYYHVSYYGAPRDYLWLCSTPQALIAEEMTKAFDYGADKVWILNVGDLKPAELATEFFLRLAWDPHSWTATNTYDLLARPIIRDFGNKEASKITSILGDYYRLNFRRKPEHIGFQAANLFSREEAKLRVDEWRKLAARAGAVGKELPAEARDAFFELVEYPVRAAAQVNEKFLAPGKFNSAEREIERLTGIYNEQIAGGKWRFMMSANPRGQMDLQDRSFAAATNSVPANPKAGHKLRLDAARASELIPGRDACWQKVPGLGYGGEALSVFPTTVPVRATPESILAESPCIKFRIKLPSSGHWTFTVRGLPTFSIETGKPQRYAIALDDEPPKIVSLPLSQDERNRTWQENVLRNAAQASSIHVVANPGPHALKIWMVDPGIVLDAIEATLATPATREN